MIQLNTNKQLNIILPNTNKALDEILKSVSPQELKTLNKGKDLNSILNGILKQSAQDSSQNKVLLSLLQNSPIFKQIGTLSSNIRELLSSLQSDKSQLSIEKNLENMLTNIKDVNQKDLKLKFENSGVFLESKIKNTADIKLKEMFSQDFKALLLKAHDEIQNTSTPQKQEILKQINKLILQIDYHQLVSHLSNTSSLYIPYAWDSLEDGNITIKKAKKGKFFTDIELNLKKYGKLGLRLGLFEDKQLNINITTQNQTLKTLFKESMPILKKSLVAIGIIPTSIRFLDEDSTLSTLYNTSDDLDMGFEVKV